MFISGQLTFLEERWLCKLENISKPSLTTFGAPGPFYNHNDEEIPIGMPTNSYKISDTCVQLALSLSSYRDGFYSNRKALGGYEFRTLSHPSNRQPIIPAVVDDEQTCEKFTEVKSYTGVAEIVFGENPPEDFIPRRTFTHDSEMRQRWYRTRHGKKKKKLRNGNRSEKQMEQRRKLDDPSIMKDRREQLAQYFLKKYKSHTQEQMDLYSTFAQRMRDNTLAFEKFCSTDTNTH